MSENKKDYSEEEDYVEETKPLTFDDMVSFTMYAEVSLIAFAVLIFLLYLYLSS